MMTGAPPAAFVWSIVRSFAVSTVLYACSADLFSAAVMIVTPSSVASSPVSVTRLLYPTPAVPTSVPPVIVTLVLIVSGLSRVIVFPVRSMVPPWATAASRDVWSVISFLADFSCALSVGYAADASDAFMSSAVPACTVSISAVSASAVSTSVVSASVASTSVVSASAVSTSVVSASTSAAPASIVSVPVISTPAPDAAPAAPVSAASSTAATAPLSAAVSAKVIIGDILVTIAAPITAAKNFFFISSSW